VPKLKFVPSTVLKLLAFNAQILRGHVTQATPFFEKNFRDHVGIFLGACMPNLKFVSLVILELLAFNAQKFKGSRDPGHAPFSKIF